jgi:hypothetical protein
MKKMLLAAVAVAAISAGSEAYSQDAVVIAPEQRTVIREYVVKQRVKPARITGEVRVGGVLPADVELVAVPNEWGPAVSRYRYVYSNNRVVLVEPDSRRVVHIID